MSNDPESKGEEQDKSQWLFNWKLAVIAWIFYAASLVLPIFHDRADFIYGWEKFGGAMVTLPTLIESFFSAWSFSRIWALASLSLNVQFLILCAANVGMFFSPFILRLGTRNPFLYNYLFKGAWFTFLLMILLLLTWIFMSRENNFGVGYYVEMASYALLGLSIRKKKMEVSDE